MKGWRTQIERNVRVEIGHGTDDAHASVLRSMVKHRISRPLHPPHEPLGPRVARRFVGRDGGGGGGRKGDHGSGGVEVVGKQAGVLMLGRGIKGQRGASEMPKTADERKRRCGTAGSPTRFHPPPGRRFRPRTGTRNTGWRFCVRRPYSRELRGKRRNHGRPSSMSSLRNSLHRRNHKERSQLAHRSRLGILEKHKDYVLRARDFHSKKDRITRLRQKAADRNKDEFYYGMTRQKTEVCGSCHLLAVMKTLTAPLCVGREGYMCRTEGMLRCRLIL